ncbi:MAG: hypothetical protein ACLQHF_10080 [Terracidiphilus sp.]
MTDAEIQLLKDSIDKYVQIQTVDGEYLTAKILFVTHSEEYDEHEVLCEMVSSNMAEFYNRHKDSRAFVFDFEKIVSVKPALQTET